MRRVISATLLLALLAGGCAGRKAATPPGEAAFSPLPKPSASNPKLILTPTTTLVGKVVAVNLPGRFVVLNFPVGRLPVVGQRLSLYRGGLKVGEVKVTGPQRDDNIVADITAGESALGDEVRDR